MSSNWQRSITVECETGEETENVLNMNGISEESEQDKMGIRKREEKKISWGDSKRKF